MPWMRLSQGKKYLLSTTWNAPKEAFDDGNQILTEGKSASEVLINLSINYKFCGYEILEGFHVHDVMKDLQIDTDLERYRKRLSNLI